MPLRAPVDSYGTVITQAGRHCTECGEVLRVFKHKDWRSRQMHKKCWKRKCELADYRAHLEEEREREHNKRAWKKQDSSA